MSKEIDEMILGFIKSKGIRKDWDYWVECWKNKKPYDPDKFTQTVEERALELYPIDKPMGEGDKLYSQEVNRGRALQRGAYIKGATDIKTKQC